MSYYRLILCPIYGIIPCPTLETIAWLNMELFHVLVNEVENNSG